MEKLAKIYKLTHKENGSIYIGHTTTNMEKRIEKHLKCMRDINDNRPLYVDMREAGGIKGFDVEVIDECFERHKFILEENWYNKLLNKGYPMYPIKAGAKHSINTKQRLMEIRTNSKFDYKSEQFKEKMSEATSGSKNGMYGKKGKNAINGRMVVAYNDNSEIVHQFNSVGQALEFLGIKGHTGLIKACRLGKKYRGYYWKKEWIDR